MCGIVAAIHSNSVTQNLVSGLDALAYRGYDSAGVAILGPNGLQRRRAKGKIDQLRGLLRLEPLEGSLGIAHTRWATHGLPDQRNAHPHLGQGVAVVHNGIIENHARLRRELERQGVVFESETDSEVIPHLIARYHHAGLDHLEALRATLQQLDGSYAVAVLYADDPDHLYAARQGSPLALGDGNQGFYLASDINAFGGLVNRFCYLENGDVACIGRDAYTLYGRNGEPVSRRVQEAGSQLARADKGGYRHYMLKEIHEQPAAIQRTLDGLRQRGLGKFNGLATLDFKALRRLHIIACGTSYYAGLVGQQWIEALAALPVDVSLASEYRYSHRPLAADEAAVFISQSGETADTLAAMERAKAAGQRCLAIVNVATSTLAREADGVLMSQAGAEIGVASTKGYTVQLTLLATLALHAARERRSHPARNLDSLEADLLRLPLEMQRFIGHEPLIAGVAGWLARAENAIFIGRGIGHALACEGALKLKEVSYIHAEAYAAGELKHGPIALLDPQMPVVVVAPPDQVLSKTLSNLREVAARGAPILLISDERTLEEMTDIVDVGIAVPRLSSLLATPLYAMVLQLIAYHTALLRGTDVDQPRNLAKSVTVE